MGIRVVFNGDAYIDALAFLTNKINWWNDFKNFRQEEVQLVDVLTDLGFDGSRLGEISSEIRRGYWTASENDPIDFGLVSEANREAISGNSKTFLLSFNCKLRDPEPADIQEKKPCYFWRVYKYHVDPAQITLRGWVDWCNELYEIQHNRPRPRNNRIFVDPGMQKATVKARCWNKDRIEKWLTDHGYNWTQTVEIKYQYAFNNPDDVILIDSDEELKSRKMQTA